MDAATLECLGGIDPSDLIDREEFLSRLTPSQIYRQETVGICADQINLGREHLRRNMHTIL